jgi:hypothetical protein
MLHVNPRRFEIDQGLAMKVEGIGIFRCPLSSSAYIAYRSIPEESFPIKGYGTPGIG